MNMNLEIDGKDLEGVYHIQLTFDYDYRFSNPGLPEESREVGSMEGTFLDGPLKGHTVKVGMRRY